MAGVKQRGIITGGFITRFEIANKNKKISGEKIPLTSENRGRCYALIVLSRIIKSVKQSFSLINVTDNNQFFYIQYIWPNNHSSFPTLVI
jgi:hypothetical protein